jgi:hypothetical protein
MSPVYQGMAVHHASRQATCHTNGRGCALCACVARRIHHVISLNVRRFPPMSDQNKSRGGSWFTFLLAFSAFIMSGTALYQQNRNSPLLQNLESKVQEIRQQLGKGLTVDEARQRVIDALNALLVEDNIEAARKSLDAMNARLREYINHVKNRETKTRLEELERRGREASDTLQSDPAAATAQIRALFREISALDLSEASPAPAQ